MLILRPVRTSTGRLFLAAALLSAWLVLLLTGWTLSGAIHLLLVGSLVAFPWRAS